MAQQIQHHQPDEQDDQSADENGKEAGRQWQVMELAHVHRRCSKILANTVARMARERIPRQQARGCRCGLLHADERVAAGFPCSPTSSPLRARGAPNPARCWAPPNRSARLARATGDRTTVTTLTLVYGFQQTVPRILTCGVFRASPQSAASRCLPDEDTDVKELIRQILSVVDRRRRRRRTQRSLANNGRSFELDAVAFRILQVDRRALAFGTIAQGLRTAGDALPGKMFRNCHRVERLDP